MHATAALLALLIPLAQPRLHLGDLLLLGVDDLLAQALQLFVIGALQTTEALA